MTQRAGPTQEPDVLGPGTLEHRAAEGLQRMPCSSFPIGLQIVTQLPQQCAARILQNHRLLQNIPIRSTFPADKIL